MTRATEPASISFDAVTKIFGGKVALNEITVDIEPGTFTVLLGPSGSGKTTLLRCVAGIEKPTRGTITLGGTVVVGPKVMLGPEKRNLAMVFQDYALWPHLSVAKNVGFPLKTSKRAKSERKGAVDDLLGRVGIDHLADRYPNELSGGEQQRVALARALAADVGLILFDEPLSNLDADRRENLRIEIATLTRESGASVLYITHDQAEAFALADRVGVLNLGHMVQWGTPEDIYREPASPFVARFTGLAGELPVRVVDSEAGRATVELKTVRQSVIAGCASTATAGTDATAFIRPSAVSLSTDVSSGSLVGVVEDSAFTGRGYEHAVSIDETYWLTKVFASERHVRGDPVAITFDPSGVVIMDEQAPVA